MTRAQVFTAVAVFNFAAWLVGYWIVTSPGFGAAMDATVLIVRNFSIPLAVLGVAAVVVARGRRGEG